MTEQQRAPEAVILVEEDVPGAKFKYTNIEEHSVREIKRWLECRGLKRTGSKSDLIERCKHCIEAGRSHLLDVSVDKGKWFDMKIGIHTNLTSSSCDVQQASSSSIFQSFPSKNIPDLFNKGHIYYYLIESTENVEDTRLSTEKPYNRGEQYLASGFVRELKDAYIDNKYVVKCYVQSSFKNAVYNVSVELSRKTGFIICGSCECAASTLGRCSHISALLLYIQKHVEEYGYGALACTSKPCEWDKGSRKKAPRKVAEAQYPSKLGRIKRATFDPRATRYKTSEATSKEVNSFLSLLDVSNKSGKCTYWQEILQYVYDDFTLDKGYEEIIKHNCQKFILNLIQICEKNHASTFMVAGTEEQGASTEWARWRCILLTASVVHQAVHLTTAQGKKLLRSKLWNLNTVRTAAMAYGQRNEVFARNSYKESLDMYSWVTTTGLWMNKKYAYLACSPDGLIFKNHGTLRGILEIKCPKILENEHPKDFATALSVSQRNSFYLAVENDVICFKKNHMYYSQVQMGMAITDTSFCDFCVWSPKGYIIVNVKYDSEFWDALCPKLFKVYMELIIPEYFLQRTIRDLVPINLLY